MLQTEGDDASPVREGMVGFVVQRNRLAAANTIDPTPDAADDEYSDILFVVFDVEALAELSVDQDYPISGDVSWPDRVADPLSPSDMSFAANGSHTVAIEKIYFTGDCWFCDTTAGTQNIQGSLRLTVNTATHLTGVIAVRVEGAVPRKHTTVELYELTLIFDGDV